MEGPPDTDDQPSATATGLGQASRAAECVVCHDVISGGVFILGGRAYCAQHYERAFKRRGTWPAVWILFAVLVALALVMQRVGPALAPYLSGGALVAAGVILSVLPALIWLFVFRRFDELEPEPIQYLLGVMILAALFTGAVAGPLRRDVFGFPVWAESRWYWAIPIYTLSQGLLLALTIYFTVRFSAFLLDEFDERADGVIYGTAAGLGAAVYYNLRYLLDTGPLRLDVGTARIIIAALIFASIGGLVGYGLGQVRFERHSVWYLPGVVLLAALLIGIYEWLSGEAISRSLGYTAWVSVLIAAVLGAFLFAVLHWLVRHAIRETLAAGPASEIGATA
jgi:RsiW-degrading membrane proteinase PrsW (M82 family)